MREVMSATSSPRRHGQLHLHLHDDLDAEFPAVAARKLGLNDVPLLCAREITSRAPCRG